MVLALRILERLAEDGQPMGVTALAPLLGTTKSRIFRHLETLTKEGYILQSRDTERYQVGARLAALGRLAGDTFDLASVAAGMLRELRDSLGHFSVVSEVEPEGVRVLAASRQILRRDRRQTRVSPVVSRLRSGKGGARLRGRACRGVGVSLAPRVAHAKTIVSPAILRRGTRPRARGAGRSLPTRLSSASTRSPRRSSAPAALVGTVSIVDSIQFIEEEPTSEQIARVKDAARQISAALGHRIETPVLWLTRPPRTGIVPR